MLATSGYGDDDVILGGRIEIDKDECAPVYFGFFGHLAEKEVIQARFPRSTLLHIAKQCMHTAHCTLHAALRQVLQFFLNFQPKTCQACPTHCKLAILLREPEDCKCAHHITSHNTHITSLITSHQGHEVRLASD